MRAAHLAYALCLLTIGSTPLVAGCGGAEFSASGDNNADASTGQDAGADVTADVNNDGAPDPCVADKQCALQNRACDSQDGKAVCTDCLAGFHEEASMCVQDETCSENTCSGHGLCSDTQQGPVCTCDTGYEGANCDMCKAGYIPLTDGKCIQDPCSTDSNKCAQQHRTCDVNDNGTVQCGDCAPGFHDRNGTCVKDTTCGPTTCGGPGRGSCDASSGQPVCTCEQAYSGDHCEDCAHGFIPAPDDHTTCIEDPCAGDPCQMIDKAITGTCKPNANTVFSCKCQTDYVWDDSGRTCSGCHDFDGDGAQAGPTCGGANLDCNDSNALFQHEGQLNLQNTKLGMGSATPGTTVTANAPIPGDRKLVMNADYSAVQPEAPNTDMAVPFGIFANHYGTQADDCLYLPSAQTCSQANAQWSPLQLSMDQLPAFPGTFDVFLRTFSGAVGFSCDTAKRLAEDEQKPLDDINVGTLIVKPQSKCVSGHFEVMAINWNTTSGGTQNGGAISATTGETVTLKLGYRIVGDTSSPLNWHQIVIGVEKDPVKCLFSKHLQTCDNGGYEQSNNTVVTFSAPSNKGIYHVLAKHTREYKCTDAVGKYSSNPPARRYTIATITVK